MTRVPPLVAILAVLIAVRWAVDVYFLNICADVGSYLNAAYDWRQGHWFYTLEGPSCPCTPLRQVLEPSALWVAEQIMPWFGWTREVAFGWTVRGYCTGFDVLTAIGLWKLGLSNRALLLGWACNPLSILLTSVHANMLMHSLALTVLAIAFREYWVVSALLLGLGIAWGQYPILIAPLLAWRRT